MRLWPADIPEPPIGIEPMTYALPEARALTAHALAALIARENGTNGTDGMGGAGITRRPGPRTGPRPRPCVPAILLLCVNVADDMDPRRKRTRRWGRRLTRMSLPTQSGQPTLGSACCKSCVWPGAALIAHEVQRRSG
jgi:hypothetical protein